MADLARLWDVPVVLVVDARGMGRSVAAMVRGYATFDERVRVVGIVANRVGSVRHYEEFSGPPSLDETGVEPLGFLLRDPRLDVASAAPRLVCSDECVEKDKARTICLRGSGGSLHRPGPAARRWRKRSRR